MKVLIGLGNPGKEFIHTRHNAGYGVINKFSEKFEIPVDKVKENCLFGSGKIEGRKIVIAMPLTYMNLVGGSVKALLSRLEVKPEDVLIALDDVSIDLGRIRIREKGSAGGHNGLKSVIETLRTENFPRLRIGIGPKPLKKDLSEFVLENFKKSELKSFNDTLLLAVDACEFWLKDGIVAAMNEFNTVRI